MTNKELLLKDLCARLPYGVFVEIEDEPKTPVIFEWKHLNFLLNWGWIIKPYLRPMSSMTEEEREKFINLRHRIELGVKIDLSIYNYLNFLYSHHIDVDNRLLNKKLAIEAPEDMYNIKEK